MNSLHCFVRQYKRIGVHRLEMYLYNANLLDNYTKQEKEKFKLKVIEWCLEPRRLPPHQQPTAQFHYLEKIPPTENKTHSTKRCTYCYNNRGRKRKDIVDLLISEASKMLSFLYDVTVPVVHFSSSWPCCLSC